MAAFPDTEEEGVIALAETVLLQLLAGAATCTIGVATVDVRVGLHFDLESIAGIGEGQRKLRNARNSQRR